MIAHLLLALTVQNPAGVQWPAVGADGRIAYERHGDLYVQLPGQNARRVTSGVAIDRQPVWLPGDDALVFVSDRAGTADLWRVSIAGGELRQLTATPDADSEPAIASDGRIVFVRGSGNTDLYVFEADSARRLVATPAVERSPSVSRDGVVAFSSLRDGRRQLKTIRIDGTQERTVLSDPAAEHPAWSPDGKQIAFLAATGRRAVMVTGPDGSYVNTISTRRGRPIWLPRGDSLLIAELLPDNAGYNGDPDRNDRDTERDLAFDGQLWRIVAPVAPDAGNTIALAGEFNDSSKLEYFDRAVQRVARNYYSTRDQSDARARWNQLAAESRGRVAAAESRRDLDQLIHDLVQKRPPLRVEASGRAGVSSAHPLATEAGLEMLRKGGNVVDAAVAVSFALGVVEPDASGVGGYGQMLINIAGMEKPALIEFMSRAPEEATANNPALADPNLASPALAIVPGTVDGMWRAWQRYGSRKVTWAQLLEPAIRLAEQGFILDDAFPTTLRREQQEYLKHESTRALFFRDGRPLAPGDTLRNPDLAWTLKQIAQGGADAFYRGEIARRMIADLRPKGNAMSLRDLSRYYAEWRDPVVSTYRGHEIFSSAPPVSGGATLAAQLNLLENFKPNGAPANDAATAHAMIEAWRLTPRSRIADPGLWAVDISAALSKDTARARWSCFFSSTRAVRPRELEARPDSARGNRCPTSTTTDSSREQEDSVGDCDLSVFDRACRATGTTAFAVADSEGNMVAVTQTLGTWGGNFYVTPGLGFIYNDKLRSYGGGADGFGARLPFARHGSTIAPTLVFRGVGTDRKPLLAAGAAGNAWITAAVYQIVAGVIDQNIGPQQALELPRFLPGSQTGADGAPESLVQIEAGFSPAVLQQLEQIGHRFNIISLPGELRMGYGAAVMVQNGKVRAGGDPRRSGAGGTIK